MKFSVHILLALLFVTPAFSQEKWTTTQWEGFEQSLEKVVEKYKVTQYSVDLKYSSYKGLKSSKPFETAFGYFQKNGNTQQSYIKSITTLQNKKIKITLDSINHIIAINHPDNSLDQANSLEQYKKTRDMVMSLKTKKGNSYLKYQLIYKSNSPIRKVEMTISNDDVLKEIRIYYANEKEYEDESGETQSDHVWLKIEYNNFVKKLTKKELRPSKMVSVNNNEYHLNQAYQKFQLIDFRLKN